MARLLAELARGPGLDAVKLIHLNDSRVPCNSRRDRHWHLGQGAIGLTGLRHLLSHPWLNPEAAILETPKPHQGYEWYNLLVARSLVPGPCSCRRGRPTPKTPAALARPKNLPLAPPAHGETAVSIRGHCFRLAGRILGATPGS